ncbi:Phist protein [Plasmodium gonderi]|uniref:Phist protein n=1 Tax=Plasmodium gonderi TaxID=77519 RepID=A0A1Y1JDV7_PLAGO|nr:Phist protein [Plasmodium gonderi]GAW79868.1 Phist protein [Plasmodium gonderi]
MAKRKKEHICNSSVYRILNTVLVIFVFLVVEVYVYFRLWLISWKTCKNERERRIKSFGYPNVKTRQLANKKSFECPRVDICDPDEESVNVFCSSNMVLNNDNENAVENTYDISEIQCEYNNCFMRNRKRKVRRAIDKKRNGNSVSDIPSIEWKSDGTTTTSSYHKNLDKVNDEIEPRKNRFVKKGFFEHINPDYELSETEFIEKISNLSDYVDPEEMSSIFYYVHKNERKKYFRMQENLVTHCENLCHNYNINDDLKNSQMKRVYDETTNFFLFKENFFLKSFSEFVRIGNYNKKKFIDSLISYRKIWKEYRRLLNNFWSAKLAQELKDYWEKNKNEVFQTCIQYTDVEENMLL